MIGDAGRAVICYVVTYSQQIAAGNGTMALRWHISICCTLLLLLVACPPVLVSLLRPAPPSNITNASASASIVYLQGNSNSLAKLPSKIRRVRELFQNITQHIVTMLQILVLIPVFWSIFPTKTLLSATV